MNRLQDFTHLVYELFIKPFLSCVLVACTESNRRDRVYHLSFPFYIYRYTNICGYTYTHLYRLPCLLWSQADTHICSFPLCSRRYSRAPFCSSLQKYTRQHLHERRIYSYGTKITHKKLIILCIEILLSKELTNTVVSIKSKDKSSRTVAVEGTRAVLTHCPSPTRL